MRFACCDDRLHLTNFGDSIRRNFIPLIMIGNNHPPHTAQQHGALHLHLVGVGIGDARRERDAACTEKADIEINIWHSGGRTDKRDGIAAESAAGHVDLNLWAV